MAANSLYTEAARRRFFLSDLARFLGFGLVTERLFKNDVLSLLVSLHSWKTSWTGSFAFVLEGLSSLSGETRRNKQLFLHRADVGDRYRALISADINFSR